MLIMLDPPLYKGGGGGVVAHSMRRRKATPPIQRQRSFSPARNRKISAIGRQRSVDQCDSYSPSIHKNNPSPPLTCSTTELSHPADSQPQLRKISTKSLTSPRHLRPCTKNRRLELAIDQFTGTALPFYLEVLSRHTARIQKVIKYFSRYFSYLSSDENGVSKGRYL